MLIDCIIGYINHNKIITNQSINRYRDNNELKYCIRSIEKYLPNLNKIHIILGQNCKPPDWLNLNNKKLNVIKESELYNPIQLNSETKKLYYHKIKNLTEYFITFDDDFYLNNFDLFHPLRLLNLFFYKLLKHYSSLFYLLY